MKTWIPTLLLGAVVGLFVTGCEGTPSPAITPPKDTGKDDAAAKPKGAVAQRRPDAVKQTPTEPPAVPNKEEAAPPPVQAARVEMEEEKEPAPEADPAIPEEWKPLNKAKNLFFEKTADGKRRVHVLAEVCLREGPLEVLMCRSNTKEHEAILRADIDAREIHTALIAAGAKYGSTVKYHPDYKPATGDLINVTLTYNKDGKLVTKPAQSWVQHMRTKKPMEHEWVFAGSRFFKDPEKPDAAPFYCANNGEVISIANFPDSMLDLPVKSSKEESELGFSAVTDRIPPLKTKVIVTLEAAGAKK